MPPACAGALGVRYDTIAIAEPVEGVHGTPGGDVSRPELRRRGREHPEPGPRVTILMAVSNKFGNMVVTTGNKSEMSVGYATLYGDMNGGFNPIKDLYKTEVYRIAAWRNANPARWRARPGRHCHPGEHSDQGAVGGTARGPDRPGQPAAL